MTSGRTNGAAVDRTNGRGGCTRRLVLGASAALAAIVVVGLGDGAVAAWFQAIGGGAAVGFAVAVLIHARATDDDLRAVSKRFGRWTLAFILGLGAAGAVINLFVTRSAAENRRSDRARGAVDRFIKGQGFWAGQPAVLDTTVRSFGTALRHRRPPDHPRASQSVLSITQAVTRGPIEGKKPLAVQGIVCSRYALVPNALNQNFGFKYIYRLVSPAGRDEVHVVSGGDYTVIARGRTIRVTGRIAATGPRRDNGARNTVFLMGLTSARGMGAEPAPGADKFCGDTP
jgi:MFS family permease